MTSLANESDEQLAPFLRQLADSIESSQLTPEQMQQVGEFYMSYKIRNEVTDTSTEEMDVMDFIRFLTLGLYIYKFILNEDGTVNEEGTVNEDKPDETPPNVSVDFID